MSWYENEHEVRIVVVQGECQECVNLRGVRDLAVMLAEPEEVTAAQRRIEAHFVGVLHLGAPGMAW
ncbi:hypothetical protein ABH941_002781 [Streptacidiphilus sp. EB103A]